ncbi:hypothetical protein [Halomarina ordinaria]|uniref:MarR family transcriptional regulator n=1 Tax=Halomarina ordinaria TaxID=3033939 RepID=A0ABD5UDC5_9EURY|nr:hypothetical protein [Halomarina sp. PSRA2]
MTLPEQTQLSPSATDALKTLHEPLERADGLSREDALTVLTDDGMDSADASHFLSELLSKGYLYAVDEHVYLTPS